MRPFRAELELCAPMGDILKAAATAVTKRVAVSASQPVRVVEIRASRPASNRVLVGGTYEQNRLIIRRPGGPRGGHGKRPGGVFSDSTGAVRPRQRCVGLRSGGHLFPRIGARIDENRKRATGDLPGQLDRVSTAEGTGQGVEI